MKTPKKCGTSFEVLFAHPPVARFEVFGFEQVDQYHEVEKRGKLFFNRLIIPFHSQDLFLLRKDQVSQIIDGEYESLPGGVVKSLSSMTHIRRMKFQKSIPMQRAGNRCPIVLLVHSFHPLR
jgi:hypothetical protein